MQKTITIEQTGDEIYRIGASDVLDVREIDAVVSVSIQQLVKAGRDGDVKKACPPWNVTSSLSVSWHTVPVLRACR